MRRDDGRAGWVLDAHPMLDATGMVLWIRFDEGGIGSALRFHGDRACTFTGRHPAQESRGVADVARDPPSPWCR